MLEKLIRILHETKLEMHKENNYIIFSYIVDNDEFSQKLYLDDISNYESDEKLLYYVLEEIYSTILGAKEIEKYLSTNPWKIKINP